MKHFLLSVLILGTSVFAADSITSWFEEGSVKGNVKYYYIETKKDIPNKPSTSAHANSIGGTLNYATGNLYGFSAGATFMTTNGFALPNSVDTSILGRDNGVRLENDASGDIAQESFSVLGEVYLKYIYKDFSALYGRKVVETPLMDAKVVRMLPSAVQGAFVEYTMPYGTTLGASYLTHFKQRTSDKFINIVKHALGNKTKDITGSDEGAVVVVNMVYESEHTSVILYDDYADDFMNSIYLSGGFANKLSSGWSYSFDAQYINQMSIGNADDNLRVNTSVTGGKAISSNAFGLKVGTGYKESKLSLAFTKVLSNSDRHDSLVLPWDGTPLFTNMITSNDLFQSNYGQALNADSIYIGGSAGIKLGYTQKYDFTGIKGFKTVLSYLNVNNSKFINNQRDYNIVLGYDIGDFSLALKGVWVRHNTSQSFDNIGIEKINQDDRLTQYRVIANYKF